MEEGKLSEWGVVKCPLVDRQCMKKECGWWVEGDNVCAILKIAKGEKTKS